MRRLSGQRSISRRQFVAHTTVRAAGAALVGGAATGNQAAEKEQPAAGKPKVSSATFRLHVLGAGCPHPVPHQYGSAFVLDVDGDFVMVDCGPATTHKMCLMGIATTKVGHLLLTHHHFDHNADFPCFALTRWDMSTGKEPPLKVCGPRPTRAFVERLLGPEGAFFVDWQSRIKHPVSQAIHKRRGGSLPRPAPAIEARDVGPGEIARTDSWVATAARVHHVEPWLESLAFRFDTQRGSIVFAGDCGDCKELRQLAQGADTLVVACVYVGRTKAYADIITGTAEVADIARATGRAACRPLACGPRFGTARPQATGNCRCGAEFRRYGRLPRGTDDGGSLEMTRADKPAGRN